MQIAPIDGAVRKMFPRHYKHAFHISYIIQDWLDIRIETYL